MVADWMTDVEVADEDDDALEEGRLREIILTDVLRWSLFTASSLLAEIDVLGVGEGDLPIREASVARAEPLFLAVGVTVIPRVVRISATSFGFFCIELPFGSLGLTLSVI